MVSRILRKLLPLLFLLVATGGRAAPPAAVDVVRAEFGVFDPDPTGELVFSPTGRVPHVDGQRYGWLIELRTRQRTVAVREEYLLPSNVAAEPGLIPLPRRNQVSQRQLVPVGGRIYGEWAIGPREPAGRRHLQVIVEGRLAGDFEFEVVPAE